MEVMISLGVETERSCSGSLVCCSSFWDRVISHLCYSGPYLHSLEVSKLTECRSQIEHDATKFGISCVKNLLKYQEIVVEHSTDIERMKKSTDSGSLSNADVVVIHNATVLTMETGNLQDDLLRGGMLVIRGGVIEEVYSVLDAPALTSYAGSTVIDAQEGEFFSSSLVDTFNDNLV